MQAGHCDVHPQGLSVVEEKSDDTGATEPGACLRGHRLQLAVTGSDAKEPLAAAHPDATVWRLGEGVDISAQWLPTPLTEANDFACAGPQAKDSILGGHPRRALSLIHI